MKLKEWWTSDDKTEHWRIEIARGRIAPRLDHTLFGPGEQRRLVLAEVPKLPQLIGAREIAKRIQRCDNDFLPAFIHSVRAQLLALEKAGKVRRTVIHRRELGWSRRE